MALRTDHKDDILDLTQNTQRKYRMITNDDGTVSFVDMTVYSQVGDSFGAAELNEIANAVKNASGGIQYIHGDVDEIQIQDDDGNWHFYDRGGLNITYLYKDGKFNTDYITQMQEAKTVYGSGSVSNTGSVITISGTRSGNSNLYMNEGVIFAPQIDLADISSIKVKIIGTDSNGNVHVGICNTLTDSGGENLSGNSFSDAVSTYVLGRNIATNSTLEQVITLDVTAIASGYLYVLLNIPASDSTISSSLSIVEIEVE